MIACLQNSEAFLACSFSAVYKYNAMTILQRPPFWAEVFAALSDFSQLSDREMGGVHNAAKMHYTSTEDAAISVHAPRLSARSIPTENSNAMSKSRVDHTLMVDLIVDTEGRLVFLPTTLRWDTAC